MCVCGGTWPPGKQGLCLEVLCVCGPRKQGLCLGVLCVLSRNSSVASFPFFPRCFILGGFVLYSSSENGTLLLLGEWKRTAGILLLTPSHRSISQARIQPPLHGLISPDAALLSFLGKIPPLRDIVTFSNPTAAFRKHVSTLFMIRASS